MWIFAYGSLIFRPSFDYLERRRAFVKGWARRFWQGSPDHRGVSGEPGRVVTLVPDRSEPCGGCAYRIDPTRAETILHDLDIREQAGFERTMVPLFTMPTREHEGTPFAEAIAWIGGSANTHFLGPLPEAEIAAYIRDRAGPSGTNTDYVLRLREALRTLEIADAHVEAIAQHLDARRH